MTPTETAALLASVTALVTVVWKIVTDRRAAAAAVAAATAAASSAILRSDAITAQTVLKGFKVLVEDLRNEVVRVRSDGAEAEERSRAREAELLAQIKRLRDEVGLLRTALGAAGLTIPEN